MRNALDDGPVVEIDVSEHACRRYRERVDRSASDAEIRETVTTDLQDAGPSDGSGYPPDRPIALGIEDRYVAILAPDDPPTVVTVWRWDESPHLLKRKGGPEVGWRHYRWLNDGLSPVTEEDMLAMRSDRIDRLERALSRVQRSRSLEAAQEVATRALRAGGDDGD